MPAETAPTLGHGRNSACNCCQAPNIPLEFFVGTKQKHVKAKFCPIAFNSYTALRFFRSAATPELAPSDPSNPPEGELYTDLAISYSFSNTETLDPEAATCFDLVSGSDTVERSVNLEETVDEDLKIKVTDLLRDSPQDQQCPAGCGSSQRPKLQGSGSSSSTTERSYSTSNAGGCGANRGDYCGPCPDDEFECFGDGSQDITVDQTSSETTTFSVNGCADNSGQWPSTSGTYTTTTTEEANCCFAFVCLGVVQTSPDPNPLENTTSEPYNFVDLPPIDEHLTATAINPLDISDVTAAAYAHLSTVEYFSNNEDGTHEWISFDSQSGIVESTHERYSAPFSEMGFSNSAEVTLKSVQYKLALRLPPATCYIKLWLAEEFLPQDYDNNNRDPITDELIWDQSRVFEIERSFPKREYLPNTCLPSPEETADTNALNPDLLLLITDDDLVLEPPEERGTTRLRILKYSLVQGYTPNDPAPDPTSSFYTQGCKPNGFPDPATPCLE